MSVVPTPLRRNRGRIARIESQASPAVGTSSIKMKVPGQLFSRTDVNAPHAEAAFLRLLRYRLLHQLTDLAFGHLGKSGIKRDDIYAFRNRSMQRRSLSYLDRPYDDLSLLTMLLGNMSLSLSELVMEP